MPLQRLHHREMRHHRIAAMPRELSTVISTRSRPMIALGGSSNSRSLANSIRFGIMVVAYYVRLSMTALCADEHLGIQVKGLVGRLNQLDS